MAIEEYKAPPTDTSVFDGGTTVKPKVAICCPGVGLVQRGYERMFLDLFNLVKDDVDITLFKGGGPSNDREKALLFASRNGWLVKLLPIHKIFGRTPMHSENMTFVLALLPYLYRHKYNIVHCIDPPMVRVLFHLRRLLGLRFTLLYTHGCTMPPEDFPPKDHTQHISQVVYDEHLALGTPESQMTMLPCGFHPERFHTAKSREELRREYDVPQDKFVILNVATPNRYQKRTHYLISEAAKLEGDFLLWVDGSMDFADPDLLDIGRQRLGDKFRFTHVPSDKVGELYAMADVIAHCSSFEAFGISIAEASGLGLPIFTHHDPHFQWLVPNEACWVDMMQPGALVKRLEEVKNDPAALDKVRLPKEARTRFFWSELKPAYLEMYARMAALGANAPGVMEPKHG